MADVTSNKGFCDRCGMPMEDCVCTEIYEPEFVNAALQLKLELGAGVDDPDQKGAPVLGIPFNLELVSMSRYGMPPKIQAG